MVLNVMVVIIDLSVVVLHIHPLWHFHEPPYVHDNHRNNLFHHVAFVGVVFELLLPTMVIYSFLASFVAIAHSFVVPILNCFPSVV
jgi:hypothetical protein